MTLPLAHLGRRYHFCASHRLHAESLSEQANRATYGKCNHPFGHGHNYVVEVIYSGPIDAATGMILDLSLLDQFAAKHLMETFDHQNLNLLPVFSDLVPTTENLSIVLHKGFKRFPYAKLERIHVEETSNNSFDYAGDGLMEDKSAEKGNTRNV